LYITVVFLEFLISYSQSLDEVYVEVETCDELRSMSTQLCLSPYGASAKYSFINKVIDGMTVSVNTVQVTFKSPAFIASVQVRTSKWAVQLQSSRMWWVIWLVGTSVLEEQISPYYTTLHARRPETVNDLFYARSKIILPKVCHILMCSIFVH
jgi:hypothetical protein